MQVTVVSVTKWSHIKMWISVSYEFKSSIVANSIRMFVNCPHGMFWQHFVSKFLSNVLTSCLAQ
jgi:hypothetical protein